MKLTNNAVVLLLALVYWPGTKGPNAYGPDPRQP